MYQFTTPAPTRPTFTFDTAAARTHGAEDGAAGEIFMPEWYGATCMMHAYCLGYLAAAPDNIIANEWLTAYIADDLAEQAAARLDFAAVRESIGAW